MYPLIFINKIDLFFMEARALTREQLAGMYGWSTKTFKKLLKDQGLILPPGTITPKTIDLIISKLGDPPNIYKYKGIIK
jgi:hypothetical protein